MPTGFPFFEHGHLRNIRHSHALIRRKERVVRTDRNHTALLVAAEDKIAKITGFWKLDVALIQHPEVIEHLREIIAPGVADEGQYFLRLRLLAAIFDRSSEQRTRWRSLREYRPAEAERERFRNCAHR